MTLRARVQQNLRDVRDFGPGVLSRHLGRLRSDRLTTVRVPSLGRMHVRAGQSDIAAIRQTFVDRQYELSWPAELGERFRVQYERLLADGRRPLIVDAGANIGAASLWFARMFPDAIIAGVEPEPGNAAVLRRNIEGRPNIRLFEAAIGGEPGFVDIHAESLGWATQTERSATGVPVVTIDQLCEQVGSDELFIVKVDIEGFERDLFASNTRWVERCFAIFIEPHDWMLPGKMTSRTFQEVLGRERFEIFIRGENLLYVRT